MPTYRIELLDGDPQVVLALLDERLQHMPGHTANALTRLRAQLLDPPPGCPTWREWVARKTAPRVR